VTDGSVVEVELPSTRLTLEDYATYAQFAPEVLALQAEARLLAGRTRGRRVWMLNTTATGGGVADMMPRVVMLLRDLGIDARWLVLKTARSEFFELTKRIHNAIHGQPVGPLGAADRALYDSVSRAGADSLLQLVSGEDILVVHDPQPLGVGALVKRALGLIAIWRCHIGHDEDTVATRAAWDFLRQYAVDYDHTVFSAVEYIRDFLAGRASIMHPTIDPLDHKSRDLNPNKLVGILCSAGLLTPVHPVLTPPFAAHAMRLASDGSFVPALGPTEIGLPFRPIVTQVSRWDRLKGFLPLLRAFVRFKQRLSGQDRRRRRIEIVRLVLAGPEPAKVSDDPEGADVLVEMAAVYRELSPELQADVAILSLPMSSRKHNALMVNCLQRCSIVVAQNSIREGFGLTATEAMWKGVPILASRASGLRQQVRDGLDGRLVRDPEDPEEVADVLDQMLAAPIERQVWGRNAQSRVYDQFLVFKQLGSWIRLFAAYAHEAASVELGAAH
jgi:trehalose synthase